jgi:hypothetical protein
MKGLHWLAIMAVLAGGGARAEEAGIGQVKLAKGQAFLVRDGRSLPARPGDAVQARDELETGADGALGVTFSDNTVFSTGPNTRVAIEDFVFDSANFRGAMTSAVQRGTLTVVSGDIARSSPGAMKVRTPTAIMGVRGTTFAVQVIP